MSRTPNKPATAPDVIELLPAVAQGFTNAQNELSAAESQLATRVRAVAASMGYQLPADCTDPDLIQRDIAANMRRSVEACLQVGMGICVLKEACQHGEFVARLDGLGIEYTVATRFMQAATRFPKVATSQLLKAAGNQSKLFDLLILDDGQIDELELTGHTGELTLDDVASMSVRELRAKLREARQEKTAVEKVLETKNKQIDKLQLVHVLPPEELFHEVKKKALAVSHDALGALRGGVRQALTAINDAPDEPNKAVFMAAMLGELQAELNAIRDEFQLPDVSTAADQALAADVAEWAKD
jgi:hypothetical protein